MKDDRVIYTHIYTDTQTYTHRHTQWNKARGRELPQDEILGEGVYPTIERQAVYDNHTLGQEILAQVISKI